MRLYTRIRLWTEPGSDRIWEEHQRDAYQGDQRDDHHRNRDSSATDHLELALSLGAFSFLVGIFSFCSACVQKKTKKEQKTRWQVDLARKWTA